MELIESRVCLGIPMERAARREKRSRLRCSLAESGAGKDYVFVVVCAHYKGKILLSRHAGRDTWETQGGHIEAGESPEDTARRELYEESGAVGFALEEVCDYYGYDEDGGAWGKVYRADVTEIGRMPASEMAQTARFEELPGNLTYPLVTPKLFRQAWGDGV